MFFIAISFGFTLLASSFAALLCSSASEEVYMMVSMTFDVGSFIVIFPVILGYVYLCANISSGKKSELSDLFVYYGSIEKLTGCYTFLLRKIPEFFVKIILPFLAISVLFGEGLTFAKKHYPDFYNAVADYIPVLHFLLQAAVLCLIYFLSGRIILSVIDFCTGEKRNMNASVSRLFLMHRLSLLPLYILSVLTFGVLFFAYTIPYTIILHLLFLNENCIVQNSSPIRTNTKEIPFVPESFS